MDDTDPDFITCPNAYVGIAINDGNMKVSYLVDVVITVR